LGYKGLNVNCRLNCFGNAMTLEHYSAIAAPLIRTRRTNGRVTNLDVRL